MLLHVLLLFPYEAWAVDSLITMSTEHIWDSALVECWSGPRSSGCSVATYCPHSHRGCELRRPLLDQCAGSSLRRELSVTQFNSQPSLKRWSLIFATYIVCSTNRPFTALHLLTLPSPALPQRRIELMIRARYPGAKLPPSEQWTVISYSKWSCWSCSSVLCRCYFYTKQGRKILATPIMYSHVLRAVFFRLFSIMSWTLQMDLTVSYGKLHCCKY